MVILPPTTRETQVQSFELLRHFLIAEENIAVVDNAVYRVYRKRAQAAPAAAAARHRTVVHFAYFPSFPRWVCTGVGCTRRIRAKALSNCEVK